MTTIASLLESYRTKKRHPRELVEKLIAKINKTNPELNAYLTLNEQALSEADKIKQFDRPLAGIPIAIKDNFCTEGLRTTASAKLLDNFIPPYDATVITRLKQAGAIIVGKTNMDAWAHGSSTETSDYGTTKNPFDHQRVPGGSSGGSAAVVAAGLPPFAIGSETAGSIRLPAAWCGVVGLKPTYGRVSRYGVIAMGSSLDSPGPLTRSVADAALLLQVIAGHDHFDATTSSEAVPNYLKSSPPRKLTIGISDDYFEGVDKRVVEQFWRAIKVLEKFGHKTRKIKLINPRYSISIYTILQRAEVSSNLCRFDGIRFGLPRRAFSEQAKRRMMLGAFALSSGYYDAYYLKAQKARTLILNNFKEEFKNVDLIAAPTTPTPALKIGESRDNPMFGEIMDQLVEASSIAGLPGINLPVGMSNGLPIGIQLMGPWFAEKTLIDISEQFEQETQFSQIKPPDFYEI